MGYDVRAFFNALGGIRPFGGGLADADRKDTTAEVEMLDKTPLKLSGDPLDVVGYVDGIQAAACIAYREHRPVHLAYTAAACVDEKLNPIDLKESLRVLCSSADSDALCEIAQGIPVESFQSEIPGELETILRGAVQEEREGLESSIIKNVAEKGPIVVDGELQRYKHQNLVGVAKTLKTRYLKDESFLLSLPKGWRSPRFSIKHGNGVERFSCYVRLQDPQGQSWNHGIVRLEALNKDLLEPLGALCMQQRQRPASSDPRYDRHLGAIRGCELVLRARQPAVFARLAAT